MWKLKTQALLLLILLLSLVLTACSNHDVDPQTDKNTPIPLESTATSTAEPPEEVINVLAEATPVPSKAAMTGKILSLIDGKPMSNTVVRLARVFWNEEQSDGAYVLAGASSPSSVTNEHGFFFFNDLDPIDYILVVGDVNGEHEIVLESDGKGRIISTKADQVVDAGLIQVSLTE
ncbi:MAG: hypothetical protein ACPGWR_04010 [Ardenticatenaceae bacterium]